MLKKEWKIRKIVKILKIKKEEIAKNSYYLATVYEIPKGSVSSAWLSSNGS